MGLLGTTILGNIHLSSNKLVCQTGTRTPLQILFLILVTDLPPSIALGMEPGEPGILKLHLGRKDMWGEWQAVFFSAYPLTLKQPSVCPLKNRPKLPQKKVFCWGTVDVSFREGMTRWKWVCFFLNMFERVLFKMELPTQNLWGLDFEIWICSHVSQNLKHHAVNWITNSKTNSKWIVTNHGIFGTIHGKIRSDETRNLATSREVFQRWACWVEAGFQDRNAHGMLDLSL